MRVFWFIGLLGSTSCFIVPLWDFKYGCGDNGAWKEFHNSCYYISNDVARDAFHGMKMCRQNNSELVSISSKEEQQFLVSQINSQFEYWIGLFRKKCRTNGENYWMDGSPFTVTFWDVPEPDENVCCSRMYFTGLWRDKSCTMGGIRYICERPKYIQPRYSKFVQPIFNDSYLMSDNLFTMAIPNCKQMFCSITCLANYLCQGFNLRKNFSSGSCFCEFKGGESWQAFPRQRENFSSYWEFR